MTAGDKMHARMERHRQLQRERNFIEHPKTGPWSPRSEFRGEANHVARQIRADVEKRQETNASDEDDDDDEFGDFLSSLMPSSSTAARTTSSSISTARTTSTSALPQRTSTSSRFTPSPSSTTPLFTTTSSTAREEDDPTTSTRATSTDEEVFSMSSTSSTEAEDLSTSSSRTSTSSSSSALTSVTLAPNTASLATSVQVITRSASLTTSAATASSTEASSGGPGAGLIIGIVAAALAGVVVIAAVVGFLVKKASRKAEPFEGDPFDKDEFRRQSAMIPEGFESDDGHQSMVEHHNYGASGYGPDESGGYASNLLTAGGAGMVAGAAGVYGVSTLSSHNESGVPRPPTMLARHADAYRDWQGSEQNMDMPQYNAAFSTGPQLPPMAYGGEDPYSLAGVAGGMQDVQNIDNPYAHLDRSPSATQFHATEAANYYAHRDGSHVGDVANANLQRTGSSGTAYGSDDAKLHHVYQETSGRPLSYEEGRSGTPDLPNVQQTYALGSEQGHQSDPSGRQSALGTFDHPVMVNPYDEQDHYRSQQQQQYQDQYNAGVALSSSPPAALQVRNLTGAQQRDHGSLPSEYDQQNGSKRGSTGSQNSSDAYGGVY